MKAKIYKADTPNANGVVYPKDELVAAIEKFNENENFAVVGTYPPAGLEVDLNDVAAQVKLRLDENYVIAEMKLLETPGGEKVQEMMEQIGSTVLPVATCDYNDGQVSNLQIGKLTFVPQGSVELGDVEDDMFVVGSDK